MLPLLFVALFADVSATDRLLGEQAWPRQGECVQSMKWAIQLLDDQLPRLAGKWSWNRVSERVELEMKLGGVVAMVYLHLATDRGARSHPRKRTGPWRDEADHKVFQFSQRRKGADQGAWAAYSEILSPEEGRAFERIAKAALDACVSSFDPTYRIARWTPNNGRIWFEVMPRF